jgi:hypothetical protein
VNRVAAYDFFLIWGNLHTETVAVDKVNTTLLKVLPVDFVLNQTHSINCPAPGNRYQLVLG